jgi:hypothetical protein
MSCDPPPPIIINHACAAITNHQTLQKELEDATRRLNDLQVKHHELRMRHIRTIETAMHWREKYQNLHLNLTKTLKDAQQ